MKNGIFRDPRSYGTRCERQQGRRREWLAMAPAANRPLRRARTKKDWQGVQGVRVTLIVASGAPYTMR